MNFFTIVFRGLLRRPVRTGLTLLGIAIGIAAVVALVGISRGFERSWDMGMRARGTDIVVNNMGTSLTPSTFDASARERIAGLPNIDAICTLLVELMSVESASLMIVSGREWGAYEWESLKVLEGRLPADGAEPVVVLGPAAAEMLNKKVGDKLQLELQELTVVGIVDGGALVENSSVILPLPVLQEITGKQGKINVIDIRVKAGTSETELAALCGEIDRLIPEAKAVRASEHIRDSQAYRIVRAMSWSTSLLAVLVGVFGVMNTMLMAVFERTKEICILLALGWRRGMVMMMILWEAALLGLLGGVVGIALGVLGVQLLRQTPVIRGILEPDVSLELLLMAAGIAILVGMLSGLYPAWRSARLMPGLALQA